MSLRSRHSHPKPPENPKHHHYPHQNENSNLHRNHLDHLNLQSNFQIHPHIHHHHPLEHQHPTLLRNIRANHHQTTHHHILLLHEPLRQSHVNHVLIHRIPVNNILRILLHVIDLFPPTQIPELPTERHHITIRHHL